MKYISNSNKTFIRNAIISENKRIDLRSNEKNRDLFITFGQEFGSCFVRLGQTIVFTNTSCEITEPKISRPNEGIVELSLDLCSASEKWVDSYQRNLPQEGIHCLRLLERTIRESRCVDTESLCLVSAEKVWRIKCHIICLNFDGNLSEATSISAIASLSHFKRPDVTVSADKSIKVHSFDEKNPLNLTLLHYPFCVSFAFFFDNKNKYHMICDPLECEEESSDASLVVAANSYREIVSLHCSGEPVVDSQTIIRCSQKAIERVKYLTDFVKTALEKDKKVRSQDTETVGFANAIRSGHISNIESPHLNLLNVIKVGQIEEEEEPMEPLPPEETPNVYLFGRGIGTIGEGGQSQWKFNPTNTNDSEESNDEILPMIVEPNKSSKRKVSKSDDEEEDEVVILETIFDGRKYD